MINSMKLNTKIKVVGVGGSGCNAVSRMAKCQIKGVELIAVNTDIQDLVKSRAHLKLRIGRKATQGLGAGMNPAVGKQSALENKTEIAEMLKGADMVFIACGLGGGTGSGAAPIVAEIAKESGALTLAVVTTPFSFEGQVRERIAQNGLRQLKERVDTLISVSNNKLLSTLSPDVSIINAFWICDDTLRQAVQGISDLITIPGIINVDFADVRAILGNAGSSLFGVGRAQGEGRAHKAALAAANSPLLDISIKGAKGILFNVSGDKDIALSEIDEVAKTITQEASPQARIIFGAVQNENLKKGELKVILIATGF